MTEKSAAPRALTTRFADFWLLGGASILFYPTAIGWHPSEKAEFGERQHEAWELIQRSHAVANGCYVAVANRIGLEQPIGGDGIEFWGQSFVAGTSASASAQSVRSVSTSSMDSAML